MRVDASAERLLAAIQSNIRRRVLRALTRCALLEPDAETDKAAALRDLPQLDKKLYLDVFAQPEMPKPRCVAAGR